MLSFRAHKQHLLSKWLSPQETEESEKGFIGRTIDTIIDNLHIEVDRVHVRYATRSLHIAAAEFFVCFLGLRDLQRVFLCVSLRARRYESPEFSVGLVLREVSVFPVDQNWQKAQSKT